MFYQIYSKDVWNLKAMENNGRNPTGFSKLTSLVKTFKLGSKLMRYLNPCDLRWIFVWLFAKPELLQSLLQIHGLQYAFQKYTWGRWTDDNFSKMKWIRTQSRLSWNFFIEDEEKEYQLYVCISKFTIFGSEGGFLWALQAIQTQKIQKISPRSFSRCHNIFHTIPGE